MNINLRAPKVITFWIAVILVILGVLASQGIIGGLAAYAFFLVVVGFIILMLGVLLKNM